MTEYKVGDKVVIKQDHSAHGFAVGTEVYLLGHDTSQDDVWLASEDPNAEARWTGRLFTSPEIAVMNVDTSEMEPALADWEKELLEPGSTALSMPKWSDLEVGDTVTIKYLPTEEEFTTKVHKGEYSALNVLGWVWDGEREPGFEDIELVSVEKAPKPEPIKLPTTLYSQIEVTFTAADPEYTPEVRHCVLVRDTDGEDMWLILSKDGEPKAQWHDAKWLEEGANRPKPMYEIKVLFEAEADD